ncbi:PAS domain S-box protein [Candidatus Sumerlaeota bacterium]|nr:PAS domain S-box protein [Candidatus Sumerlaeota bacterium]
MTDDTPRTHSQENRIRISGIDIEWRPNKGVCAFEKMPVAMMWVDTTLGGLMSAIQAMVGTERFVLALQSRGRESVEADWGVISKFPDFRDGFKAIANIAAVAGWGAWELVSLDVDGKECRFRVADSWEGRYQKALGVCWGSGMVAGKMAGYASKLFETNCWADQTSFIARGDTFDEFTVGPSPRTIEDEIERMLASDQATRADMAVALRNLEREIAERAQAEEALRESEEKFRALVETSSDWIWEIDLRGKHIYTNARIRDILAIEPEELLQASAGSFVHPEDIPRFETVYAESIAAKKGWQRTVLRWRHADGSYRWLESNAVAVTACDGNLTGFRGVDRDITERKQAGEALRRESAFSQAIVDRAAEGLCVCHGVEEFPCVRFTVWNARMVEITGYTMEEINRMGWYQTVYPDPEVRSRAEARMARMREGDDLIGEEWVIARKNGEERTLMISTSVVEATDGTAHVLALMHDITERKRAEEAERRAQREWEDIFQAIGHPTIILDSDQRIVAANRAMLQASGKRIEELQGELCFPVCHGRETTSPPESCPFRRTCSSSQVETEEMEVEAFGGTYLVSCTPVLDAEGRVEKTIHIATDITDRKKAEAERLELERHLLDAQKLESLGILAGGIAHDFNNLLMAVLGNLDLAQGDTPRTSLVRVSIEQAMLAARRATDLTRQLLAYSGKGRFVVTRMDLSQLVQENADLFRAAIARTVSMNLCLQPRRCVIEADPGQLQQVIMNLITNASEAIGEAAGTIALATGVQECDEAYLAQSRLSDKPAPGSFVFLEVSDTGDGMNEETIEQIFDPFFTTKFTGRGLGMPAVSGIVRGHKGAILIESAIGKGTTIRVLFPDCGGESVEVDKVSDAAVVATRPPAHSGKILVADDEEAILHLCEAFLRQLGYQALSAADGQEALALFERHSDEIEGVLLDLTMPRMDGLTAFREMRRLRPDIKVILCSGYSEKEATRRFTSEGLTGFLQKPYLMRELREMIERVLPDPRQSPPV